MLPTEPNARLSDVTSLRLFPFEIKEANRNTSRTLSHHPSKSFPMTFQVVTIMSSITTPETFLENLLHSQYANPSYPSFAEMLFFHPPHSVAFIASNVSSVLAAAKESTARYAAGSPLGLLDGWGTGSNKRPIRRGWLSDNSRTCCKWQAFLSLYQNILHGQLRS